MNRTKIEWCDYTVNPVKGLCPMACPYCYARRMYKRFKWNPDIRLTPLLDVKVKEGSRIFVGSTIELFGEWVRPEWLVYIFKWVRAHPAHTFIFLTKQPQNLIKWSPFPENCWVGVTATNFETTAQGLYTGLPKVKAPLKFISFEPLLGETKLRQADLVNVGINWLIIGSQTQPVRHPERGWVDEIIEAGDRAGIPIFVKEPLGKHYGISRKEVPR